jgi:hypothetical protein
MEQSWKWIKMNESEWKSSIILERDQAKNKQTSQLRYEMLLRYLLILIFLNWWLFTISLISLIVDSDMNANRHLQDHFQRTIVLKNFIARPCSYQINFNLYVHVVTMQMQVIEKNLVMWLKEMWEVICPSEMFSIIFKQNKTKQNKIKRNETKTFQEVASVTNIDQYQFY